MKNVHYLIAYVLLTNSIFISTTYADAGQKQDVTPSNSQPGQETNHPQGTHHMFGRALEQHQGIPPATQEGQAKTNEHGNKKFGRKRRVKEKGPLTPAQHLGKIIFTLNRIKRELREQETPQHPGMNTQKPQTNKWKKGNKPPKPHTPLPLPESIDDAIKHLTELKEMIHNQVPQTSTLTPQPALMQATPVDPLS